MTDNPIQDIFNRFFGQAKVKNIADYLDRLTGRDAGQGLVGNWGSGGLAHMLGQRDPYRVLQRLADAEHITDFTNFHDLGLSQLHKDIDAGEFLGGTKLKRALTLTEGRGPLVYLKNGKSRELYRHVLKDNTFIPIALQTKEGIVNIGNLRAGALQVRDLSTKQTSNFADIYYDSLAKGMSHKAIMESAIGQDHRGSVKLRSLLQGNAYTKGLYTPEVSQFVNKKMMLVSSGSIEGTIFKELQLFQEARSVKAGLLKTVGRWHPEVSWAKRGMSATAVNAKADEIISNYSGKLASLFGDLGIAETYAFGKPENLISGDKPFVVPTTAFQGAYSALPEAFKQKGAWQLENKIRNLSRRQRTLAESLGIDRGTSGREMTIAVADFDTKLQSRMFFGEQGALMTSLGRESLAAEHNIGTLKFNNLTQWELNKAHKTFGIDPVSLRDSGSGKWHIQGADVAAARNRAIKYKDLTNVQKDVRDLMRLSKTHAGVWDAVARTEGSHVLQSRYVNGTLEINFGAFGTPEAVAGILGGRRHMFTRMADQHQLYRTGHELAQKYKAELIISKEDFLKQYTRHHIGAASPVDVHMIQGMRGIQVIKVMGGTRLDFATDFNPMKGIKFNPNKMQVLAKGSRLLGYGTPMEDPMYRILSERGGLKLDPVTLQHLANKHVTSFGNVLVGGKVDVRTGQILRATPEGLMLGSKRLKNLPSLRSFSNSRGGVSKEELVGTILDPKYSGKLIYLDLETSRHVGVQRYIQDGMEMGADPAHRLFPISMPTLRASKYKNGKLLIGENHPGMHFIEAFTSLEMDHKGHAGILESLRLGTQGALRNMIGRKGLFSTRNEIVTHMGMRVNPVPDMHGQMTLQNMLPTDGSIFDITASRETLIETLEKRAGLNPKAYEELLRKARSGEEMLVMLGADPAQRGEHMRVARLRSVEGGGGLNVGQLNVSMNPMAVHMLERDFDMDKMFMLFLDAMPGFKTGDKAALVDRMLRQQKAISPYIAFFKHEMTKGLVEKGAKDPGLVENITGFIGQKVTASDPYSLVRGMENYMSPLISQGLEGIPGKNLLRSGRGGRGASFLTEGMVTQIQKGFAGEVEHGAAMALTQMLFQSAVKKGGGATSALNVLESKLLALGDEAAALMGENKRPDIEHLQARGKEIVKEFLTTPGNTALDDEKFRAYGALDVIQQHYKKSTGRMLIDLESGAEGMKEARTHVIDTISTLLGNYLGPAAGVGRLVKTVKNPTGLLQGLKSKVSSVTDIISKMVGRTVSSIGKSVDPLPSAAPGEAALKAIEPISVASLKEGFSSFVKSPAALITAGAIGGLMLWNTAQAAMFTNNVPLPPPIDTSQPTDRGPIMPNYSNTARINAGPIDLRTAKRSRSPVRINQNPAFRMRSGTSSRVTIQDQRSPMNPATLSTHMRNAANSDFNY